MISRVPSSVVAVILLFQAGAAAQKKTKRGR